MSVLESAEALLPPDEPLLALVSGGGDSVALLDVAVRLGARVSVLHVNYGLREGADADEEFVRDLCSRLGVPLFVERVTLAEARAEIPDELLIRISPLSKPVVHVQHGHPSA